MPLKPVSNAAPLPVDTENDVRRLFDLCASIGRGDTEPDLTNVGHYAKMSGLPMPPDMVQQMKKAGVSLYLTGLADHFLYVGAVHPEYLPQLNQRAARLTDNELDGFRLGFDEWLYVMRGASDDCVQALVDRLHQSPRKMARFEMLAAILTPTALQALADFARSNELTAQCENMGFAIPEDSGPAEPRFLIERFAVQLAPDANLEHAKHTVGLPVSTIAHGSQPDIVWHYLSVDLSEIPEAESLPFNHLHLVSPAFDCDWTIYCQVTERDLYEVIKVSGEYSTQPRSDNRTSRALLIPFDDSLTYTNGHVFQTENVHGIVGGPPIGLYPNPKCPTCNKLMLHICTVQTYIHEFGEGFRCLYACETCRTAACTGVGWN